MNTPEELDRLSRKMNELLRNEDLLPKKILALQVELGELGNYTRKHWGDSLDQIHRARWKSSKT